MDIADREERLKDRLKRIKELEDDVARREQTLRDKESTRKQVLLRLTPGLWEKIASWAADDFRSINSQIEFILSEAVKKRFGGKDQ